MFHNNGFFIVIFSRDYLSTDFSLSNLKKAWKFGAVGLCIGEQESHVGLNGNKKVERAVRAYESYFA